MSFAPSSKAEVMGPEKFPNKDVSGGGKGPYGIKPQGKKPSKGGKAGMKFGRKVSRR